MSEHMSSDRSATGAKRQWKSTTRAEKLGMIRIYGSKESTVDTANTMRIPESVLRTIRKQANKIQKSRKGATRMTASKTTQIKGADYGESGKNADSVDGA
jgi:hypothetical protein